MQHKADTNFTEFRFGDVQATFTSSFKVGLVGNLSIFAPLTYPSVIFIS